MAGRPVRGAAARPAARVLPRAGVRRGLQPARRPRARVVRAARRARRAAVLDVARGLRRARRAARRRPARRRRRRLRLLPRLARGVAVVLVRRRATCGSPARATCSPSSTGCAARCTPRGCSRRRSGSRSRRCRAASASSPARAARRATTCSPALRRRGWAGRVVWAFAPVQDRHAAPAVTRALQDLAACAEVDVVIVARGGGSLADLFAFCDETLCRTVALLRVPVIASVGHHTDRTLIDDVAAVSCSTPTHAAEAAVPVDCAAARAALHGARRAAGAPGPARDRRARAHARAALARAGRPRRAAPHAPAPAARASCARARAAASRPSSARSGAHALALERKDAAPGARPHARRDPRARRRRGARAQRRGRPRPARPGARAAPPGARRARPAAHARARLRARRGRAPARRSRARRPRAATSA